MLVAAGAVESSWVNLWGCREARREEEGLEGRTEAAVAVGGFVGVEKGGDEGE